MQAVHRAETDRHEQGGQKKHCDLISSDKLLRWTSGKSDAMAKSFQAKSPTVGKGKRIINNFFF